LKEDDKTEKDTGDSGETGDSGSKDEDSGKSDDSGSKDEDKSGSENLGGDQLPISDSNPNKDLSGSLQLLPQSPLKEISQSSKYNAQYNQLALQGHNTYRRAHQVCDMKFDPEAAAAA
jgi:hypothetical protein